MKPDWKDAPEWAQWLLYYNYDYRGEPSAISWAWYENEPSYCLDCGDWHEDPSENGQYEEHGFVGMAATSERRP